MEIDPSPDFSAISPSHGAPARSIASKIFLNERGLRAGWRLLIYALLVAGLGFVCMSLVRHFVKPVHGVFSPGYFFLQESVSFAVIFGAALIMARIEMRSPDVYGLPLKDAFGKLFWQGALVGLIEITALIGLIATFGGYSFGAFALHGPDVLRWGLFWGGFFVVVGLFEEFLFRGYTQYTLADGIGFWPAAILLSIGFGLVHLGNPGEGWIGAAAVVMIGLIFAFALRRTGNLWFVVGLHATFDFGETFLFSVPNSGIVLNGHLSNATLHGGRWLTGGTVGPEGSVFSFLTMFILAIVIHFMFPARNTTPLEN
ncbi:MAG TPA: CPBP family intramembrane glutamic endopeptidase [Candidatus Dormibacteraeota bacterium]|nr:CPBP family intramembrane glutamic endopeptidase [Candidatus Dormibacteraeota bacterium]